jgi:hypothetical protein
MCFVEWVVYPKNPKEIDPEIGSQIISSQNEAQSQINPRIGILLLWPAFQ